MLKRLPLLVLCSVAMAGCNVEADFSDAIPTQTLQAEQYQQEIAAIDRLLFTEKPLGEIGTQSLEKIISDLAARVSALPATKFLTIESLELKLLAKRAGQLPVKGTGQPLQNEWMRIRNNLFDDRAWFVRSANDLEYAASVVPPLEETSIPVPQITIPSSEPRRITSGVPPVRGLTGRWRLVSMTTNGKPASDADLDGAFWSFDPPRLVIRSSTGKEENFGFTPDGQYLRVSTPSATEGWMLYELGDGLRIAFFDGLLGKPTSFEPPAGANPALAVVTLVRE